MSLVSYSPLSHFASCPAATGEIEDSPIGRCPDFRDGGHRCDQERGDHSPHHCTCGVEWISAPPRKPQLDPLDEDLPASYFHAPQHLAPE